MLRPRLALALAVVALAAASCGGDRAAGTASPATDPGVVHVHGLGVNPRDGTLYVATHTGLFTVRDGRATRVGERFQDTMGFTVAGPDHFLGSGHPDLRDTSLVKPGQRPLLGLIESRDAGRTWRPLSLLGEADFHALEVGHGLVYGYDATGGRVMVTRDRKRWEVRSTATLHDFSVSPTDPQLLVGATEQGLTRSIDGGRRWQPVRGPAAVVVDWDGPDDLWAVTQDGQVWSSADAARRWVRRGSLPGPPEALLVQGGRLYAAVSERGIVESADAGRTWEALYRPSAAHG